MKLAAWNTPFVDAKGQKNQGSLCSKSCQRLACLKYSLMLLFQYYVVICILPFLFLFLIHGSCTLRRVPLQEPRHTSNVCSIESLQDPCPEFGVSVEKIKKENHCSTLFVFWILELVRSPVFESIKSRA